MSELKFIVLDSALYALIVILSRVLPWGHEEPWDFAVFTVFWFASASGIFALMQIKELRGEIDRLKAHKAPG